MTCTHDLTKCTHDMLRRMLFAGQVQTLNWDTVSFPLLCVMPKNCRRPSSNSNARPPSSRSRSPLRAPPSEPRPQDAPHKQGYRRVTGQHWCAACKDLLPQYFETGWENWVLIAPGGSKHDAGVFLFHVWSLVCCAQDLDMKKV